MIKMQPLDSKQRKIYAIKCKERNLIKIGISIDVERRAKQLKIVDPEYIRVFNGSHGQEFGLHWRLRNHKESGEWFRDTEETRNIINDYKCDGPNTKLTRSLQIVEE